MRVLHELIEKDHLAKASAVLESHDALGGIMHLMSSVETGGGDSIGAGDGGASVSDSEGNSFRSDLSVTGDTVGGAASPSVNKCLRKIDLDEMLRTPVSPRDRPRRAGGKARGARSQCWGSRALSAPPSQWVTSVARAVPDAKCAQSSVRPDSTLQPQPAAADPFSMWRLSGRSRPRPQLPGAPQVWRFGIGSKALVES